MTQKKGSQFSSESKRWQSAPRIPSKLIYIFLHIKLSQSHVEIKHYFNQFYFIWKSLSFINHNYYYGLIWKWHFYIYPISHGSWLIVKRQVTNLKIANDGRVVIVVTHALAKSGRLPKTYWGPARLLVSACVPGFSIAWPAHFSSRISPFPLPSSLLRQPAHQILVCLLPESNLTRRRPPPHNVHWERGGIHFRERLFWFFFYIITFK